MTRRQALIRELRLVLAHVLPALVLLALVCVSSAQAQQLATLADSGVSTKPAAPVEAPRPKRVAPLRTSELPGGARITITADAALDDYSAYRAGDSFFVLLPHANVNQTARDLAQQRGLVGAHVEQRGADVLISFQLSAGTTAHVKQNFNRLDVILSTQDPQGQPTPAPSPQQQGGTNTDPKNIDKSSPPSAAKDSVEAPPDKSAATPPASNTATGTTGNTPAPAAPLAAGAKGRPVLPPEKAQPVRIPRFESAPVIDGKLDDAVWKSAAVFKNFYQIQPGDNIAPSKPTEMLMGYDSHTLYIAWHCYDEPDKVRSTVAKRDQIFNDDYVGFYLDTFNDRRKAFIMFFNPLGVQADGVYTEGQGEDYSPDFVMESKGSITTDGYVIEIALPFKSLRYEAGKDKQWGVQFFRRIQRLNNELDSWMPISRDISGTLNQTGHITGLEGISTERTLELIPSITVSETGRRVHAFPPAPFPQTSAAPVDNGRFVNSAIKADIGLTAKYSLTPTITLDFAYNPDFAQVEADQTVVTANQRFPIFFQEKRPFFLEGKDIFDTANTVVHTRAIIDPDFAAKLTGKRGRNTFGLILASDNAPGNFSEDELDQRRRDIITEPDPVVRRQKQAELDDLLANIDDKNALIGVLRLKHDVGRESNVGMFATSYNFIQHHNQLLGFDGRFKTNPTTVVSFELIGTTLRDCTRDFSTGALQLGCFHHNGFGYSYTYDVTKRHYGWTFTGNGRTSDYRADVGFTQRVNTNDAFLAGRISNDPKPKAKFISWRLQDFMYSDFDWQGRQQGWTNGTNFNFTFAKQTYLFIGTNIGYERLFAFEFNGQFAGQDQERQARHKAILFELDKTFSKKYAGYVFMNDRHGAFDFDFGAGPRFPRVSLAALAQREVQAAGFCTGTDQPVACLGLQDPGPGTEFDVQAGFTYQPTSALRTSIDYTKARLRRYDTGLIAFNDNIYVLRATYQFTRFAFARARVDYDTLASDMRGQFLFGYTPNPGTALYVGYNDDLNRNGFNPFSGQLEPGFRRNGRVFFIKATYLIRHSFGGK
jgi:Domain of unknown function (DUF5916)/Carbohydrate family 9 binding domain-like